MFGFVNEITPSVEEFCVFEHILLGRRKNSTKSPPTGIKLRLSYLR